jgi:hypothetical protein
VNSKEDSVIKTETEKFMKENDGADPWIFLSVTSPTGEAFVKIHYTLTDIA